MKLQVGDRVGYSSAFVWRIGGQHDVASRRGVVVSCGRARGIPDTVQVAWNDGGETTALASNLARVGSARFTENT